MIRKLANYFIVTIASILALYLLLWGFIVGVYCNKFNYMTGAIDRDSISRIIVYGMYPHFKIPKLLSWHGWCASMVNRNGAQHLNGLVFTYYVIVNDDSMNRS